MYPDNWSYRAVTRVPFTGEHGVSIFPASHLNLPQTRALESPKPDWVITDQEGTKPEHMPCRFVKSCADLHPLLYRGTPSFSCDDFSRPIQGALPRLP
jgi:hypothetical protein